MLDVNPVVTQHVNGAPAAAGWGYHAERPQIGGTARWGLTNTLTMTGTAHPDFAEVESDAGQFVIDPRRALFFPEKRPFFHRGTRVVQRAAHAHLHAATSPSLTRRSSSPGR